MIDEIHVRDIALIRDAVMRPADGLTVLTGETGAGKTALLSACKLLMGERADRTSVREGAREACVEGRFFLPASDRDRDDASDDVADNGTGADDSTSNLDRDAASDNASESDAEADDPASYRDHGSASDAALGSGTGADGPASALVDDARDDVEVVVVRRLSADGRSRVNVNGGMSSVSELASLIGPTVDLCGQHEHQMLMRSASHALLLDAWGRDDLEAPLAAYRRAYDAACEAARSWEQIQRARSMSQAALDEARFTLRQIDEVGVDADEYDDLVAYLDKAEHAESLARATHDAHEGISGEGGAVDCLNAAVEALSEGARFDGALDDVAQSLREAGFVLEDAARDIASYRDAVEYDPAELARAQERVSAIQGLMRSYGPRLQDVLARREEACDIVSSVDDAGERERVAKRNLDEAEEALSEAAAELHEARCALAPQFAGEVSKVMARLEMGTAELSCEVGLLPRDSWGSSGPSSVEFLFRPASGMQALPLARIASGGEMSRVMLAVHVVLGDKDGVATLVFDEVDSGVGGVTAAALAGVLDDLSKTHQVIVVTHLAQIAAHADVHYVVEKSGDADPETRLHEVEGDVRVAEIARMLSGAATEASLAHARELLESAQAMEDVC